MSDSFWIIFWFRRILNIFFGFRSDSDKFRNHFTVGSEILWFSTKSWNFSEIVLNQYWLTLNLKYWHILLELGLITFNSALTSWFERTFLQTVPVTFLKRINWQKNWDIIVSCSHLDFKFWSMSGHSDQTKKYRQCNFSLSLNNIPFSFFSDEN